MKKVLVFSIIVFFILNSYGSEAIFGDAQCSDFEFNIEYHNEYHSSDMYFKPTFKFQSSVIEVAYDFQYTIKKVNGLGEITNGGETLNLGTLSFLDLYEGFNVNCIVNCAKSIGTDKAKSDNLQFEIEYSYFTDKEKKDKKTGVLKNIYIDFYYNSVVPTTPDLKKGPQNGRDAYVSWSPIYDPFGNECIYTVTCNNETFIDDYFILSSIGYKSTDTWSRFSEKNGLVSIHLKYLSPCTTYPVRVSCKSISGIQSNVATIDITTISDVDVILQKNDNETNISMPNLKALQSIILLPGFMFQATTSNSLIAHIVEDCSPSKAYVINDLDEVNREINLPTPISNPSKISITPTEADNFSISPNPAKNTIQVSLPDEQNIIEIYTMNGVKLNVIKGNTNVVDIDISAFAKGVYLLKAVSSNYTKTLQFIKE